MRRTDNAAEPGSSDHRERCNRTADRRQYSAHRTAPLTAWRLTTGLWCGRLFRIGMIIGAGFIRLRRCVAGNIRSGEIDRRRRALRRLFDGRRSRIILPFVCHAAIAPDGAAIRPTYSKSRSPSRWTETDIGVCSRFARSP
ncbi:hypothetical protein X566_09675 [Afipia sp. P52-10]|nr:hypothetical protein X566_09675 [Afipia sp. P52-10]